MKLSVEQEDGGCFQSWSSFLAPVNDMEYSSICTNAEFTFSNFCHLLSKYSKITDATFVSKADAKASLQQLLQHIEDGDGEALDVNVDNQAELLKLFDEHTDASLFLYSTHQKLGPRTSLIEGQDYSLYYKAINNILNTDHVGNLKLAIPLLRRMMYLLLYDEKSGQKRVHVGGRVWKGDVQRPVPLNVHRLREALKLGTVIRFRQFQSTTSDEQLAKKYLRRGDGRGFMWTITIPAGFWGARDIQDVAWRANESETLFPPYSAFRVTDIGADHCCLEAVDRSTKLSEKAKRHGVQGTAVELIGY